MDVKSDFLHVDIHEEIYIKHPEGYITDPYLVFKIKSLYGLKQAPREWYSKMDAFYRKNFRDVDQIQMCIYSSMMVI